MELKYKDANTLQKAIDKYFIDCEVMDRPMGFTGLAVSLGFASRQSVYEYSKRDDELSLPIKKAMLKIEASYEEGLRGHACTGSIFALKNRGWKDKRDIDANLNHNYDSLSDEELDNRIAGFDESEED